MGLKPAIARGCWLWLIVLGGACGDDAPDQRVHERRDAGQDAIVEAPTPGVPDVRPDASALESPDAAVDAGDADAGRTPDAAAADATPARDAEPIDPATSQYCGDAIRDSVTEECDDGPGDEEDSCTSDCRVRAAPVLATEAPMIALGTGTHVADGGESGFGVVYLENAPDQTRVWFQPFDLRAHARAAPTEVSAGAEAAAAANPVLAALPGGRFALAYTDASSGNPDVRIRLLEADGRGVEDARTAHESSAGFQQDPDVLWTGRELIVAFTDLLDVKVRRFDAELAPLGAAEHLGASTGIESMVTLASFANGWAAAFRANEEGLEHVEVVAQRGSELFAWRTEPGFPGPTGDRPALIALDDRQLLLLFTVGTDPLATGSARVGRLRAALLHVDELGLVESAAFEATLDPFAGDETLGQRRPGLLAVGTQIYVAWESDAPNLGETATQVFVAPCRWTDELVRDSELALPLEPATRGRQRNPRLGRVPLFPDGALVTLWEERSGSRISFDLRPSPFVHLDVQPR